MAKRPTTQKQPPKEKVGPFHLLTGTVNQFGPPVRFPTDEAMRKAIVKHNVDIQAWCRAYNKAGLVAIQGMMSELASTPTSTMHKQVSCVFDDRTGMTLAFQFWKE